MDGSDLPHAMFACSLIETLGIPFTGATTLNYLFVSDKVYMKRMFDRMNIPTPKWQVFMWKESADAELIFHRL